MRTLLFLALAALGLYWYAERYGLAVGYPPFLPVFYWKYTGEAEYPVRVTGLYDALKVKVSGRLEEGRLRVVYGGAFQDEVRFGVSPGAYLLRFELQGAKGQVRYDWVTTKFAP